MSDMFVAVVLQMPPHQAPAPSVQPVHPGLPDMYRGGGFHDNPAVLPEFVDEDANADHSQRSQHSHHSHHSSLHSQAEETNSAFEMAAMQKLYAGDWLWKHQFNKQKARGKRWLQLSPDGQTLSWGKSKGSTSSRSAYALWFLRADNDC